MNYRNSRNHRLSERFDGGFDINKVYDGHRNGGKKTKQDSLSPWARGLYEGVPRVFYRILDRAATKLGDWLLP